MPNDELRWSSWASGVEISVCNAMIWIELKSFSQILNHALVAILTIMTDDDHARWALSSVENAWHFYGPGNLYSIALKLKITTKLSKCFTKI
jgi:hypothetical protein